MHTYSHTRTRSHTRVYAYTDSLIYISMQGYQCTPLSLSLSLFLSIYLSIYLICSKFYSLSLCTQSHICTPPHIYIYIYIYRCWVIRVPPPLLSLSQSNLQFIIQTFSSNDFLKTNFFLPSINCMFFRASFYNESNPV